MDEVLINIGQADKTMKLLQKNSSELCNIIESTKDNGSKVEANNLPQEPLLERLKQELQKVRESGAKLEVWLKEFLEKIKEFKDFLRAKFTRNIPVRELSEKLDKTHNMAKNFYDAFDTFLGHLSESQQLAVELAEKLKQQSKEMDKKASRSRNGGAAGTVGLTALGAGAAALGFFTGGATWVAAGAIAGAACGVGAVTVATRTALNVKEMRQLAADIKLNSGKLHAIASDLKSSADKAGAIQLNGETEEALKTALEFLKRDLEKDDRIAELEEKLRRQGLH
ncbi:hypothetical protein BOX15_Mlig013608g1 [Macrostomum lignano]|uniref:Uncharacterized protein n=1 Tax=Macrostomum lignano TaxID=282301 RepID=A0A267H6G7_9PLAT|nr:hypothetical protein BOX15_Mlig013608g1 [Macrostomum lignano]